MYKILFELICKIRKFAKNFLCLRLWIQPPTHTTQTYTQSEKDRKTDKHRGRQRRDKDRQTYRNRDKYRNRERHMGRQTKMAYHPVRAY